MTLNFLLLRQRLVKYGNRALTLPLAAAAILLIATAPLLAQDATITEWAIPSPQNAPANVGQSTLPAGDDGVYFTESVGGKIARLNMKANRLAEWTISQTANPVNPNGLARGEERIFFTEVQPLVVGSPPTSSSGPCPPGTICPINGGGTPPPNPCPPFTLNCPPNGSGATPQTPSGGIGALDPESGLVTLWPLTSNSPGFPVFRQGLIYFLEAIDNRVGSLNPATGDLREWELPPPVPPGGGMGCISSPQPSCGVCCQGLEDFFSGTPTSSLVLGPTVVGLDADREGDNLWFSEDVSQQVARLNIPTNTLTEWAIPATNGARAFEVRLHKGLAYFTAGGSVMRLDPNTNVISVWNDPTAVTTCPPPSTIGGPLCVPTILSGLSVSGHTQDSDDGNDPARVLFSVPGIRTPAWNGSTPTSTIAQIGEFVTANSPHSDYPIAPVTSTLTPVDSQVTAMSWASPKSFSEVEPTAAQLSAVQIGGFTSWTLEAGNGPYIFSKLHDGSLVFTRAGENSIAHFSENSGGRHDDNQ